MMADDHCITDSCVTYSVMYLWIEGYGEGGSKGVTALWGVGLLDASWIQAFYNICCQGRLE